MFLASMDEILQNIADAINESLGPLQSMKLTGGDVRDLIIQLCATIILFIVIRAFLWKPVTNILEKRRESIDGALTEAKQSKEQAKAIEIELADELAKAKSEIKGLLAKAEKEGNITRDNIILEAKEEAKRRLANLEEELIQEKNKMQSEIRKEIIDIAFAAAEKIISKEINQEEYLDFIEDLLKEAK